MIHTDVLWIAENFGMFAAYFIPGFFYLKTYKWFGWNNRWDRLMDTVWSIVISVLASYLYDASAAQFAWPFYGAAGKCIAEIIGCIAAGFILGKATHSKWGTAMISRISGRSINTVFWHDTIEIGRLYRIHLKGGACDAGFPEFIDEEGKWFSYAVKTIENDGMKKSIRIRRFDDIEYFERVVDISGRE